MAAKLSTRDQKRQKMINSRDNLAAAREYCDRHGFVMPLEYFLAIGNGKDPRTGQDVFFDPDDLSNGITVAESTKAMTEAAKYIYMPMSKIEVSGDLPIQVVPVQVDEKIAASLAAKLAAMGIGDAPVGFFDTDTDIDFEDL